VHGAHALGGGFPDMVVRISTPMVQIPALVEVKTADGRLKLSQETFLRLWGTGCVAVVQTREDVFAHVERVRQQFRRGNL
jgi:hypothetical protein